MRSGRTCRARRGSNEKGQGVRLRQCRAGPVPREGEAQTNAHARRTSSDVDAVPGALVLPAAMAGGPEGGSLMWAFWPAFCLGAVVGSLGMLAIVYWADSQNADDE